MKSLSRARLFVTPWSIACTKLLRPWDFPGKSTGLGCHFLLQGIFPTQGSNSGLPHCRQTLYRLSNYLNDCLNFLKFMLYKWTFHSPINDHFQSITVMINIEHTRKIIASNSSTRGVLEPKCMNIIGSSHNLWQTEANLHSLKQNKILLTNQPLLALLYFSIFQIEKKFNFYLNF